jgi:hypothetical protein
MEKTSKNLDVILWTIFQYSNIIKICGFDLIMGGMIGNAVGFNFGGILKSNFIRNEKAIEEDKKQD